MAQMTNLAGHVAALDSHSDPVRLEAAATAIAASGEARAIHKLATRLRQRSFLRRLDPGQPEQSGGEHLLRIFSMLPSQIAKLLPNFADRTTGSGSTLNGSGNITANLYDHIIVRDPAATAEIQGNAKVLDVRSVAGSQTEYFSTMSDHLPSWWW
jgi:hypothetical protein